MKKIIRAGGFSLFLGGVLTVLINITVTPLMMAHQPGEVVPTTDIFLIRQSASRVTALLLLFGCVGLYLAQISKAGVFKTTAFLITFIGSCLLFAVEFASVSVLRAVAQASPDTFAAIDKNLFTNIGFASSVGLFAVGWILFSISTLLTRILPRWAAAAALAGLILIPFLQATPLGLGGAIVGNIIFGAGLSGLGLAVFKSESSEL